MARTIDYDINVNSENAVRTIGIIEGELQQVNTELRELDVNSVAFQTASQRAQGLTEELTRVNTQVEGFTSQRRQEALQGTIDIFTGAIEVVSGLSAVLGVQDERLERVLTRLVAVSQAANGIRTVTAGFIALNAATRATTASTRTFNSVSRRNILILVASLAAAGIAYLVLNEDVDEATDGLLGQAAAIQALVDAQERANLLILEGQRRRIEVLAAEGATETALDELRLELTQNNVRRISEEVDALESANASEEEIAASRIRLNDAIDANREQLHQNNLTRIRQEMEAQIALERLEAQLTDSKIGIASGFGDFLTTVAGENEELAIAGLLIEQAAAIATVVVGTIRSNATITAEGAALAIPTLGASVIAATALVTANTIASGVAVAALIAQTVQGVSSIKSGNTPSGVAAGGGTSGVVFGPTLATPSGAPQTQIAGNGTSGVQAPTTVIAVVAQGDIRNTGERDARTRRKARLNRRNNG